MSRRFITLGTWEDKPLQWMVLKEESTGTLVISKYELFIRQFDENNNNNWEKCTLRKYLNNDFFQTAFSKEEQKKS